MFQSAVTIKLCTTYWFAVTFKHTNYTPVRSNFQAYHLCTGTRLLLKRYQTIIGKATRLRAGLCGVRLLARVRGSYSSFKRPDWPWFPPSLLLNGYRGWFPRVKWQGSEATTHLHPAPRLRMSGTVTLLSLHAFVAWTGKPLHLYVLRDFLIN
jgi:hypothetical protein